MNGNTDIDLIEVLKKFKPISLDEMSAVKLMNRIDSKYLTSIDRLPEILLRLITNYYAQEINGNFLASYKSLYFDTPDVKMYVAHHNRKLNRQKLRTRIYCETGTAYCEIKNKSNKGRTKKKRVEIEKSCFETILNSDFTRNFINKNLKYNVDDLIPQLRNSFNRITLVNYEKTERVTIDTSLYFYNQMTQKTAKNPNLVIIEVKQDGLHDSPFKKILLDMKISPYRISKYCLGTVLTNPSAKANRFLKKIRYINKITNK